MSRDTTFVIGTIVRAEYLNADQEVDTGLTWGLRLAQDGVGGLVTRPAGTDQTSTAIIGGKRAWKNTDSDPATPTGAAGQRVLWATTWGPPTPTFPTGTGILPDYMLEVHDVGDVPLTPYYRILGTTEWNGTQNRQVRLTNGVEADAFQYNSFVLHTVTSAIDANNAMTLAAYTAQDDANAHLFTVGVDNGTEVDRRYWISSRGVTAYTPVNMTDVILRTNVSDLGGIMVSTDPDTFSFTGYGLHAWGDGTFAQDTFLERSGVGTLKISGLPGADATLDLTHIQNSTALGNTWVNFLSDINMYPGQVLRYDGDPFGSIHLADAANVAHLGDDPYGNPETFIGDKTFDSDTVFNGEVVMTNDLSSIEISNGKRSRIATRAFTTFMM
jgi:hypothetical protein